MTFKETKVHTGGLMRCCTATIDHYIAAHAEEEVTEDMVLDCEYEGPDNQQIALFGGVWQWAGVKRP